MPQGVQLLCKKLNKHWTNIAHHLYLKHECPCPLPNVGPLSELLNVTRKVATDINALVIKGELTASCVSTLIKERCIKLLGKLISWLQQQPSEHLLLNTEQQESLWQLLLVTLANILRIVAHDSELAEAYQAQLQESGLLSSLSPALNWVLQEHPHRCLCTTAGAWLLLQEVLISSNPSHVAAVGKQADNSNANNESDSIASYLAQLGPILQGYVDQAYITNRHPAGSRNSGSGNKKQSKEGSSSGGGSALEQLHSFNSADAAAAAAAAAAVAAAEDGSWAYTHPVQLTDDPSSVLFSNLLALLHCLQSRIIDAPLAIRASATGSSAAAPGQQRKQQEPVLPARAFLQLLAIANTWLQDNLPPAAAAVAARTKVHNSSSSGIEADGTPPDHLQVMPSKDVAMLAAFLLGIDSSARAHRHITHACEALQEGLFDLTAAAAPAVADASAVANTPSAHAADGVDSVLGFKLLLESVALLQLHSQSADVTLPLEQLGASARGCSRHEMQQLIVTRGQLLLQVLSQYLMHDTEVHRQQQGAAAAAGFEQQHSDAGSGNAERCVLCAHVLIQMCPGRVAAPGAMIVSQGLVDDQLLGSLTEQDPARFYAIMDHLVRHVQPQNLQVLLPMSASFLTTSLNSRDAAAAVAESAPSSSSNGSDATQPIEASSSNSSTAEASESSTVCAARAKKSMVILSDYAVCRSFAAALHGYSKSVVGPVLSTGQQQQQRGHSSNGNGIEQQAQQSQLEHDTPVHFVLPPLQKVAEWLATALEDSIITAQASQVDGFLTAAAALDSNGKPKSPKKGARRQQLSPQAIAAQIQHASQAAACGLVLVTLLARAAVPVMQELQQMVQQLPAAEGAANSSPDADASISEIGAIDVLSGLMFVRAAYQALCARCYLTQVLNELPAKLFQNGKAVEGTSAADEDAAALQTVRAALRGEELARGWAHLVQPVPPGVVMRVRGFQEKRPGDFVANLQMLQQLQPVEVVPAEPKMQQFHGEASSQAAAVQMTMFNMPGQLKQQLNELLNDLLTLFSSLLSEVPLPVGCNNPACANLEGVAEASLSVNKRCKNCLAAHYCCKQCQTEHWASHKAACTRIKPMTTA